MRKRCFEKQRNHFSRKMLPVYKQEKNCTTICLEVWPGPPILRSHRRSLLPLLSPPCFLSLRVGDKFKR